MEHIRRAGRQRMRENEGNHWDAAKEVWEEE